MRIRPAIVLVFAAMALIGCKNREAEVVGTWSAAPTTLTTKPDKTFTATMLTATFTGTWKLDGDDVVITPLEMNGKPIGQMKAMLKQKSAAFPQGAKDYIEDLDKPDVLKLSDDGKTMTTDKAKDTNIGPPSTFTKKS